MILESEVQKREKKYRNETRTSQILAKHYFQPQVPN